MLKTKMNAFATQAIHTISIYRVHVLMADKIIYKILIKAKSTVQIKSKDRALLFSIVITIIINQLRIRV